MFFKFFYVFWLSFVSPPVSSFPLRRVRLFLPAHPSYLPKDVPCTTNGKLVSRATPFVSRPGSFLSLRRVCLYLPPHPSYRDQQASPSHKSPPPVKRVVRRAGYKPLLLGQRLKALAFALRSGQTALDSSPPLKGHSYYWP